MALQLVNLDTPGTGLGDPLRDGGLKINANFTELYALLSQTVNAGDSAFGGSIENRVQLAIDHAAGTGKKRVIVPSVMLPYNASLITFNNTVQMTREGGWDIAYDVDAYGAYGDDTTDDSVSFQAAFNGLPALGGIVQIGPKKYRAQNITPSITASYDVLGAGRTASIVRPPAATPSNPVFDLTNSNGPAKTFKGFKIIGANDGLFESTGFKLVTTNGLILRDIWMAGLLIGVDWGTPCSYLDALGTTIESCGTGFLFRSSPIEVAIEDTTYFQNQQDLDVTGDCSLFEHVTSTSSGCSNTSVYAHSATSFRMSHFSIQTAVNGVNLTGSPDSSLSDYTMTGCTNDFVNSGTLRVYSQMGQANHAPFYGAGLYIGSINGGKRRMITTGMPDSLSWDQGDEAEERLQVAGTPVRWHRLTTGAGHVLNTDWKAGPNL